MEGGTPDGIMNARSRTDGLTQDSSLNRIWSAPVLFAEQKEIKAGTNRISQLGGLLRFEKKLF